MEGAIFGEIHCSENKYSKTHLLNQFDTRSHEIIFIYATCFSCQMAAKYYDKKFAEEKRNMTMYFRTEIIQQVSIVGYCYTEWPCTTCNKRGEL